MLAILFPTQHFFTMASEWSVHTHVQNKVQRKLKVKGPNRDSERGPHNGQIKYVVVKPGGPMCKTWGMPKLQQPHKINLSQRTVQLVATRPDLDAAKTVLCRMPHLFKLIVSYLFPEKKIPVIPGNMILCRAIIRDVFRALGQLKICRHECSDYNVVTIETLQRSRVFFRGEIDILCLGDFISVNTVDINEGAHQVIRRLLTGTNEANSNFTWALKKIFYLPWTKNFFTFGIAHIPTERGMWVRDYYIAYWMNEDGYYTTSGRYNAAHLNFFGSVGCCV